MGPVKAIDYGIVDSLFAVPCDYVRTKLVKEHYASQYRLKYEIQGFAMKRGPGAVSVFVA